MMGTNEVMIANNPNSAGEKILAKTGYAIIGNACAIPVPMVTTSVFFINGLLFSLLVR